MSNDQDLSLESNTILSELDKGLRSCRMGDECESIVRFPDLFAKHPFPILINSACLKLAELFRNSSNFSRLLILRVFQQAERHLEKILNLDEFIRRITTVCYSNDPVARAITLRVLGSIACVASQRKNLHHAIRNSLDSSDEIEVQAAIIAAALFAKKSSDFALSIYPKILSILNNTSNLSVDTKVKLLSVLHHEHYNSEISKDVRKRCLKYLDNKESNFFISSVLNTLTYISITSLTDVPDQIDVLLDFFKKNSDLNLKIKIINELKLLTKTSPHFWTKKNICDLSNIFNSEEDNLIQSSTVLTCGILSILKELIKCPCLLTDDCNHLEIFYKEAKDFCIKVIENSPNLDQSHLIKIANCLLVLTELSNKYKDVDGETIKYLNDFIKFKAINLTENYLNKDSSIKLILKCVVTLANKSNEISNNLIEFLCLLLANENSSTKLKTLICQTVCAINNKKSNTKLIILIKELIINDNKLDKNYFCSLCTVYFQLGSLLKIQNSISLDKFNLGPEYSWFQYKLMRQTMRFGHHEISYYLCENLQYCASNENIYFWFMGLSKISKAECCLIQSCKNENKNEGILSAIALFSEAISFLKTSDLEGHPLSFSCEFIKLRSKFLHNNLMLTKYCKMIRSSPAASISNLIALNSRDDILKCGSIVNQMRENCKEFKKLSQDYCELYQNSFNADQNTLLYLQLLQNTCTLMAEAIESVFHANRLGSALNFQNETNLNLDNTIPEHYLLTKTCMEVNNFIKNKISYQNNNTANRFLDSTLSDQIDNLLEISERLISIPLIIPRYFFQPLQNTQIKLAISLLLKPQSTDQIFVIYANTNFALKVEGLIKDSLLSDKTIIEKKKDKKCVRKVEKILLEVNSTSKSNLSTNFDLNKKNDSQKLQSIVIPHNDYFQEQFLLNLKTGYHQVNVEAFVIDETETQWKTGANSCMNVKVLEEAL